MLIFILVLLFLVLNDLFLNFFDVLPWFQELLMFDDLQIISFSWIRQVENITISIYNLNIRCLLAIFSLCSCLIIQGWTSFIFTHGFGVILLNTVNFIFWQMCLWFLFRFNFRVSHLRIFYAVIRIIIWHMFLFLFFSLLILWWWRIRFNAFLQWLNLNRRFHIFLSISKWLKCAISLFCNRFKLVLVNFWHIRVALSHFLFQFLKIKYKM